MQRDLVAELVRAFNPDKALEPGDKRYVDCSIERGTDEMLKHMTNTIYHAEESICLLLSGHRGCGKTTELKRLQQEILHRESPFFVSYCEADSYFVLSDIEYTEVLLAVIQQLADDTKKVGIRLEPSRTRAFIEELWGVLSSPFDIKTAEFSIGIAKLGGDVKKNPDNRQTVRNYLRFRTPLFLEAVNEVMGIANEQLKQLGYRGIVIIVDNLDRLVREVDPITHRINHEALFIDSNDHLRDVACNVIYTVPPALLYSSSGAKLQDLYNTTVETIPMIPVTTRDRTLNAEGLREIDKAGLRKLVEIILKRLEYINTTPEVAFDSEDTIMRLCKISGGHVRILMTLVREAANYTKNLPITRDAVERAIRNGRDLYMDSISSPQQWHILRVIAQGKDREVEKNEDFLELIQNSTILKYRDKEGSWYDVNPVVREIRGFAP